MAKSFSAELKAMGVSPEQLARTTIGGKPLAEYERTTKRSDAWGKFKSKWEVLYSMELEDRRIAGEIIEWKYEEIRLKTEDARVTEDGVKKPASRYTPDFAIWFADGRFEFHEIKGYQRPKDMKQYELARLRFPHFEFRMLTRTKAGGWQVIR